MNNINFKHTKTTLEEFTALENLIFEDLNMSIQRAKYIFD